MNHSTTNPLNRRNTLDPRVLRTASMLGVDARLSPALHTHRRRALQPLAARVAERLLADPGTSMLITGPSGAGKSTLLAMVRERCGAAECRPLPASRASSWVACVQNGVGLIQWGAHLARFGLAEASLLLSRVGELSAGERARLDLAVSAWRAHAARRPVLVVDEWCALLDPSWAAGVATGCVRWGRQSGVSLLCASSRAELAEVVDVVIGLDGQGGAAWNECGLSRAG